jgi:choline dehydrogenase-like flavoprotein
MIRDARSLLPDARVECDICIIGSGAAGITVANELRNSGMQVVLLEAGGTKVDPSDQDVYAGEVVDPDHHGALHLYRHRRFGGTTPVWGGRCAPFDPIDFEARPYVPWSGWPVDRDQLDPYYARANEYCDAGKYSYSAKDDPALAPLEIAPGFHAEDVSTDFIWRFSLPTDFSRSFRRSLAEAPDITVYLHANTLKLRASSYGNSIDHVEAASSPGRRFSVHAREFVVAAGGLESARLLLVSNDVHPAGVGNGCGLVGRYYISHITGDCGQIRFTPKGGAVLWDYERSSEGVYCRRAFSISERKQREEGLLNFRGILSHPPVADPRHGSSVLSTMYLIKRYLVDRVPPEYSKALSGMKPLEHTGAHCRNIAMGPLGLASFGAKWLTKRILAERKLPSVTMPSRSNIYTLHFDGEQAPNPDSRILLSERRDAFGNPRLKVDWRFQEQDVRSIVRCSQLLGEALVRAGVGVPLYTTESVEQQVWENSAVGSHHIGATRMASDPSRGVVDENCRVFGIANLSIASSSVFPTSSFANPTLTIVAFAVRIAAHLRNSERSTAFIRSAEHSHVV